MRRIPISTNGARTGGLAERPTPKPKSFPLTLAKAPPRLFAGTSGWAYPTWKPGFYPATVPAGKFLSHYASQLNSCEVNYTFRKLPEAKKLADWLALVPGGFRLSFKAPQRITHFSRLRECDENVAALFRFIAPAQAAGKAGVVLFQLPPNFKANLDLLAIFLAAPHFRAPSAPPIAFEFRHESWFTEPTRQLLIDHNAALCIAETEDFVSPDWHTASTHTCYRLRQTGGYKPRQVTALADRILPQTGARDVYAYFKHEDEPTGALNAVAFSKAAGRKAR